MNQTPAHQSANADLIALIPPNARHIVDVGCMHGALAREYRRAYPQASVTGIDIDASYTQAALEHCTHAVAGNIENFTDDQFDALFPSDCWTFGDCLEHLHDPWKVLQRIRSRIDPQGCVVVCIPNAQHWSVQWRLLSGNFRYEDSGLLDRTHIRWFTRVTMLEMFAATGWQVAEGAGRHIRQPKEQEFLRAVGLYAAASGLDPQMAITDATPFQYLFRLVPMQQH